MGVEGLVVGEVEGEMEGEAEGEGEGEVAGLSLGEGLGMPGMLAPSVKERGEKVNLPTGEHLLRVPSPP